MTDLEQELRTKQICRFCLAQDCQLSDIFTESPAKSSSVPLSLQIMACVSIEVFINDGLPSLICPNCRFFMDHTYKFKQICKQADQALKQFPLTGKWPEKIKLPLEIRKPIVVPNKLKTVPAAKPVPMSLHVASPTVSTKQTTHDKSVSIEKIPENVQQPAPKRRKLPTLSNNQTNVYNLPVVDSIDQIKGHQTPRIISIKRMPGLLVPAAEQPQQQSPPKLLNQTPILLNNNLPTILNRGGLANEMNTDIITNADGNIEIIQVLEFCPEQAEPEVIEPDPIKDATRVVDSVVYSCTECERSFPLRQLLEIHMKNHIRERNFDCKWCDKKFFSKYDLAKHTMIHTGDKPFVCAVCSKGFSRSTLLTRHQKTHWDSPQFICKFCEQCFVAQVDLDKHILKHLKRRPFPCQYCEKSFAFKQGLERHETIHAAAQPFPCEYCELSFTTAGKLARHLVAHAGNKRRYPCKFCPKAFMLSHHLSRHLRSHNEAGVSSYKCNSTECDMVFKNKDELIYHSAVHATQNFTCPLCKEKFTDLDSTTAHIETHSQQEQYSCDYCDLIFITEQKLKDHWTKEHLHELCAVKEENIDPLATETIEEPTLQDYEITDQCEEDAENEQAADTAVAVTKNKKSSPTTKEKLTAEVLNKLPKELSVVRQEKAVASVQSAVDKDEFVEIKVGDQLRRVKKVMMTKAEADAMAKKGNKIVIKHTALAKSS